ncbi:solute carrier family 22 member 18-like [Liolophura sinensis]|uniref:solute carrier family 22 member 18-like n=1 Tax=Liolophura sinensis TaxID=3198878 RepID=UPI0031591E2B
MSAQYTTISSRRSVHEDQDEFYSYRSDSVTYEKHSMSEVKMKSQSDAPKMSQYRTLSLFGRTINFVVLVTHILIFLYATCFWIQTGALPYLTKKLGVDPVVYGYLQTTFAIVQLAGGPLFGRFGDLFGGRAAMSLAFVSAALSYGLVSMAYSVPVLFLSRLPSVFLHAMQGGLMIVTDVVDSKDRASAIGKLSISYGLGMVIGPLIGGLTTKHVNEQFSASLACGGSLLCVLIVFLFIPKQTKRESVLQKQDERSGASVFSVSKLLTLLSNPKAFFLLSVKMGTGIPIGIFQSMFAVVAMETFKLPADQNGYIMAYIGILGMIVQGFGTSLMVSRFGENSILKLSTCILAAAYLFLAFVTNIPMLLVAVFPLVIGLSLKNVVITSALTHTVSDADTGAMLGLNMATNSLIRSVSPTVGGLMLKNYGFPSFGTLGFVMSSTVAVILFFKLKN